jgi:hypothetical protein
LFFSLFSPQSPQMVMSGLQGTNPSCRTGVSTFRFLVSRALLILAILDIVPDHAGRNLRLLLIERAATQGRPDKIIRNPQSEACPGNLEAGVRNQSSR